MSKTRLDSAVNIATRLVVNEDVFRSADQLRSEKFRVCFFSRISPKKNLDFALRVVARVRVPVDFDIYGNLEDRGYWEECLGLIAKMPSNVGFSIRVYLLTMKSRTPCNVIGYFSSLPEERILGMLFMRHFSVGCRYLSVIKRHGKICETAVLAGT